MIAKVRRAQENLCQLLEAMAVQGLPERTPERQALAAILRSVTRTEARLDDFLARADVLLSQQAGRRTE